MNGGGRCFDTDCDFDGGPSPNGLFVSEDGVEEPDFEGTGGGGGDGFDSHCWEAGSWFTVLLVGGVPVSGCTRFEFMAVEVEAVEPPKSSKPQASSTVSLTGDTIDEFEPPDVWRIGSWLVEGVTEFNEPKESIWEDKERVSGC